MRICSLYFAVEDLLKINNKFCSFSHFVIWSNKRVNVSVGFLGDGEKPGRTQQEFGLSSPGMVLPLPMVWDGVGWYGSVSPHGLLFILVRNCIRTQFWSASHHPRLHLLQERAIVILKHSCKAWFHNKKRLSNTGRGLENKRFMCPCGKSKETTRGTGSSRCPGLLIVFVA